MSDETKTPEATENKTPSTDPANLVAPKGTPTQMVAPAPKKLYKMEVLRDTEVNMPGETAPTVKVKGDIIEVEEKEAIRLANKTVTGTYGFAGERDGHAPKQVLRAARPWQPPKEELKQLDPLNPLNFQETVA